MDHMTGLQILASWKDDGYDFILVIINSLAIIVHYKLIQVLISINA